MQGLASPPIVLRTDVALLCAYDPRVMKDWVRTPRSSWVYAVKDNDFGRLDPVRDGKIAVWPLGGKGGRYTARVVAGELPPEWKAYEKGSVAGGVVTVETDHLFVGPGERIPGDGFGDRVVDLDEEGKVVPCPNGRYSVSVHVLDWKADDKFFDAEGEPVADAPPDLALVLVPQAAPAPASLPSPIPLLLDFLPKPKAKPIPAVLPRPPRPAMRPEVARPARGGSRKREAPDWKPAPEPERSTLKPGEIGIGSRVRHAQFGEGTVLFIREGFPKVKVAFGSREEKLDRSEITAVF